MRIGTDIVSINRVAKSIDKFGDRYKKRFLNPSEIQIAKKTESIAGYWAAKEAISKALGCGIGAELSFLDIIIYKDNKNAPYFKLSIKAQNIHNIKDSSLSISHDGGFAIAVVILKF